ncbi:MAG TPA: holo-ACP synthase [Candidatus Babeliales bacterium]|nr:holo-ACP synthase [Candidatus Babeliales bacterium]
MTGAPTMTIKTGCDLVYLPKFQAALQRTPQLLARLFTPHELAHTNQITSLAGKFAVKEAVIKALPTVKAGDWHQIEVSHQPSGKPTLKIVDSAQLNIVSSDISITHDGDYVLAVAVFLLGTYDDFKSNSANQQ